MTEYLRDNFHFWYNAPDRGNHFGDYYQTGDHLTVSFGRLLVTCPAWRWLKTLLPAPSIPINPL